MRDSQDPRSPFLWGCGFHSSGWPRSDQQARATGQCMSFRLNVRELGVTRPSGTHRGWGDLLPPESPPRTLPQSRRSARKGLAHAAGTVLTGWHPFVIRLHVPAHPSPSVTMRRLVCALVSAFWGGDLARRSLAGPAGWGPGGQAAGLSPSPTRD